MPLSVSEQSFLQILNILFTLWGQVALKICQRKDKNVVKILVIQGFLVGRLTFHSELTPIASGTATFELWFLVWFKSLRAYATRFKFVSRLLQQTPGGRPDRLVV